jgi:hypothetical protein
LKINIKKSANFKSKYTRSKFPKNFQLDSDIKIPADYQINEINDAEDLSISNSNNNNNRYRNKIIIKHFKINTKNKINFHNNNSIYDNDNQNEKSNDNDNDNAKHNDNDNSIIMNNKNDESESYIKKSKLQKSLNSFSEFHNTNLNIPNPKIKRDKIKRRNLSLKIPNINIPLDKSNPYVKNSELNETLKATRFNSFLRSTGLTNSEKNNSNISEIKEIKANYFLKNDNRNFNEIKNLNITNNVFNENIIVDLEEILNNKDENESPFYKKIQSNFKLFDKKDTTFKINYPDKIYMKKEINDDDKRKKQNEKRLDKIFEKKMDYKIILKENLNDIKNKFAKKETEYGSNDVKRINSIYSVLRNTLMNFNN